MTDFSIDTAFSLIQSTEQFPVNFDDAWTWLEFSTKGNAKRNFEKSNFKKDLDFVVLLLTDKSDNHKHLSPQEKSVLHRTEQIQLSVECFKKWAMMVNTEKGKLVRQYFLECEAKLKEQQVQEFNLPKTYLEALKALVASEESKLLLEESLKSADDTITGYRNIYSGNGTLSMKQAADALNIPKLGRNNLIKYLRTKRLLTKGTGSIPTRYALEQGYMEVETKDWTSSQDGTTYTNQTAQFTFKGFCWLVKELQKDSYRIRQTPQAMWDTYFPVDNIVQLRIV